MTRIGTYGSGQFYLARINELQLRSSERQVQLGSRLKSVNYTGISRDTDRLINYENQASRIQTFRDDNALAQTKLKSQEVSLNAIETVMKNFRDQLEDFATNTTRNQQQVEDLQKFAFNAMIDMQSYLSASVDGKYIFSGGRVNNEPVRLIGGDIADFQSNYDGYDHTYPTTRTAHMLDLTTTNGTTGNISFDATTGTFTAASLTSSSNNPLDLPVGSKITVNDSGGGANDDKVFTVRSVSIGGGGTTIKVSPLTTESVAASIKYYTSASTTQQQLAGTLDFSPGADTIQCSTSTGFTAGQVFEVSGTASNDGSYQVSSIVAGPPDVITIESTKVTTQAASANITVAASSWYNGDTLAMEHRIDTDRTIDLGIYASDPTFEKAFRAMGLIAQGSYGTAGGLESNLSRVDQARYLIKDALQSPAGTSPPFGTELTSCLTSLQKQVGINQNLISVKDELHQNFQSYLEQRATAIEGLNETEYTSVYLQLQNDNNALQASYQALAKVRQMSLLNFLN